MQEVSMNQGDEVKQHDKKNITIRLHSYNDSLHTNKAINNRYYLTN